MSRRPHHAQAFHRLLALLACLLLVGLQQESLRHGVRHIGEQVAAAHACALALPAVACDECALLAAASTASVGTLHTPGFLAWHASIRTAVHTSVAVAAPRPYAARAPPQRA